MRPQQVRGSSVFRRAVIRRRVQVACEDANNLPYQDGIPPRKWDKAKKIFCQNLKKVIDKMDKFDDYSIEYFETRVTEKLHGGVLNAVKHTVHKFVGI